jgi:hypothetical protein
VAVVVAEPRAIISWSSILAGALIAVAVLFLLSVTVLAAGLEVAPLADAGDPMLGPVASAIVTGLFILIAFGAGGSRPSGRRASSSPDRPSCMGSWSGRLH